MALLGTFQNWKQDQVGSKTKQISIHQSQVLNTVQARETKEEMLITWERNGGREGGERNGKGRPDVQFLTSMFLKPSIYC